MNVTIDGLIYELQSIGGIKRTYDEIIPRMLAMEPALRLVVIGSAIDERLRCSHPRLRKVGFYRWPWDRVLPEKIVRLVYRRLLGPDIVMPTMDRGVWHSSYYSLPRRWRGPVVMAVVDMIHERFPEFFTGKRNRLFRARKKKCIQKADAVICNSETTRQDVRAFYNIPANKTFVTHLACSDLFKPADSRDRDGQKPFLLFVGTRVAYKNFKVFLEGYRRWKRRKEVCLVVVGPPWTEEEKVYLSQSGLKDDVMLKSGILDSELCRLYQNALAFVYPSLYEGFGIPLLEAMACGCPVIASRIPSTEEVAGTCPYYFDSRSPDSLQEALEQVWRQGYSPQKTRDGLERVKLFSWEQTAGKTLDIYSHLLNFSRAGNKY